MCAAAAGTTGEETAESKPQARVIARSLWLLSISGNLLWQSFTPPKYTSIYIYLHRLVVTLQKYMCREKNLYRSFIHSLQSWRLPRLVGDGGPWLYIRTYIQRIKYIMFPCKPRGQFDHLGNCWVGASAPLYYTIYV